MQKHTAPFYSHLNNPQVKHNIDLDPGVGVPALTPYPPYKKGSVYQTFMV